MDDNELRQRFHSLSTLVEGVKESLERELVGVRERIHRVDSRVDKIAAGAHYVPRLVEWSEIQDLILWRTQGLETRMQKMQGNSG